VPAAGRYATMRDGMDLRPYFPWLLRAAWVALPFSAGAAIGAGLHPFSEAVRLTAEVVLWVGWAVVLIGTLAPWPVGLTALRIAAPAAAAAAAAAALTNRPSAAASVLAVATTLVALRLAFTPTTGRLYANGPAYPNERRFPLTVPGPLLLGPLPLAWAVTVGAPVAGSLLLAARQWVAGGVVLVVGGPAAIVLARALHGLSRRWVIFVPAGLVLHDPMSLTEPILFEKGVIETLRPAPAGSDSLDLTLGSPGLALELILRQKVPMVLARPGRRGGKSGASARLLFTPTRPGLVLREAEARRVPVG
jgi:hypothetical protein